MPPPSQPLTAQKKKGRKRVITHDAIDFRRYISRVNSIVVAASRPPVSFVRSPYLTFVQYHFEYSIRLVDIFNALE